MSYPSDSLSDTASSSQTSIPPSPSPPHVLFPSSLFSPLLFSSNSPLASPLTSPTYPLRSIPFDQSTVAPFERRTNLCDTYVHDHSANSLARPSSPISESPILPNSHRALCIDLPESGVAPSPQDARSSPQSPLVTENEWSISKNFQDPAQDLCFDDEGLSPLERIYLFCRSHAVFHRVYISRAMVTFLPQISPQDAVEYVVPLLSGLAMDEDDAVKEVLSTELVNIIWWFLVNCQIVEDEVAAAGYFSASMHASSPVSPKQDAESLPTLFSVQTFTPILGTLLLSPNVMVGSSARGAVVELLRRIKLIDGKGDGVVTDDDVWPTEEDGQEWSTGLFGRKERGLFEAELLHQVVIGMGRLDMHEEEQFEGLTPSVVDHRRKSPLLTPNRHPHSDSNNSYFPPDILTSTSYDSSPLSSPPQYDISDSMLTPRPKVVTEHSQSEGSENSTPDLSPDGSEVSFKSPSTEQDQYSPQPDLALAGTIRTKSALDNSTIPRDRWSSGTMVVVSPPQNEPPSSHFQLKEGEQRSEWIDVHIERDESHHVGYAGGETLDQVGDEYDDAEQAAVGRLSSMSLMAAVAASGSLAQDMQAAFVKEVERVGQDSVFWVRREASYALGALAKIVPVEIVVSSLLPLLEALCQDTVWHVRHSALFALPAILSRLSPEQRRILAVNTLLPLSEDVSSTVRIGVLEGLGEVLYTFHEDEENVPQELLDLFKGRRDMRENRIEEIDVRIQQVESDDRLPEYPAWNFGFSHEDYGEPRTIWNDPARPLICAFNYPAVALTLGKERWPELRELYADLAKDPQVKVRRTLAASLGELAKIIGPENAQRDLMDVFRSSITAEEGEVRSKAVEASEVFVTAISEDDRSHVVDLLIQAWKGDQLKGWREREGVIRLLAFLVEMDKDILLSPQELNRRIQILNSMMLKGLQDDVSSVRDTAVSVIPVVARTWRSRRPQALKQLLADIRIMASDDKYSRRMVFVACQQQLLLEGDVDPTVTDPEFWEPLERLASDHIIGVRIGVARLLSQICDKYYPEKTAKPGLVISLANRLSQDSCKDVRSFVVPIVLGDIPCGPQRPMMRRDCSSDLPMPSTFSRPPPPMGQGQQLSYNNEKREYAQDPEQYAKTAGAGTSADDCETHFSRSVDIPRTALLFSSLEGHRNDSVAMFHSSTSVPDIRPNLVRTKSDDLSVLA